MKTILLTLISFVIFFSYVEATAQSTCSFSGNKGNDFVRVNPCAPSEIKWNIFYRGLDKDDINEVIIDWGDNVTLPIRATLKNIDATGNPDLRKWEVDVSHSYPQGLGDCEYKATVSLIVNNVKCDNSEQSQNVVIWDTDDVLGEGLLTDVNEHLICAGNEETVNFRDVTQFTCIPNNDSGNLGRWVQWEYGTVNTITGEVEIGGQTKSFPYKEAPVYFDKTATASNVSTKGITVPTTSKVGEVFVLTLNNWNSCNPYEVGGVPTGNPPVTKTVYIRIIDAPHADFDVAPDPECVSNTVTFSNHSTPGLLYAWDFGDGTTSALSNPTKSYASSGTYNVTLTVTNNLVTGNTGTCFSTVSQNIEILPDPVASFTINPASAQCGDTDVSITNTSTNVPSSGTIWKWEIRKNNNLGQLVNLSGTATGGSAATTKDIVTKLPYFGTAASANYVVRLLTENTQNGCNSTSGWQTIAVKAPVSTPVFSSPLLSRCQDAGTTHYTAIANYAENGYEWELTPASAGTINNTGLVTWNAAFNGTAIVKVTAKGCGPSKSKSINVNVTPIVGTPTLISGVAEICQGVSSGTYTTSAVSATSYSWAVTGTGNTISGTGTTATVSWDSNFSGDATISVKAIGCDSESTPVTKTVTVKPTPQFTNPASDYNLTICSGELAAFNPTSDLSGSYFKWTTTVEGTVTGVTDVGDNKLIGTDKIADVLVNSDTDPAKVIYHIIPFKDGCEGTAKDFTVIVSPGKPDDAGVLAGTNLLCETATGIIYNVPTIRNAVDYVWALPAGATITAGLKTREITVDFTNTTPGNYTISVYGENTCGVGATSTYDIAIKPKPELTAIPDKTAICHGEEAVIALGSSLSGTNYSWIILNKGPNIQGESIASDQDVTEIRQSLANTGTGPESVTYRITPLLNDCEGEFKDIVITVNPLPDVNVNVDATSLCDGSPTNISLGSNVSNTTFSWEAVSSDALLTGAADGSGNEIKQTLVNSSTVPQTVTYTITPTAVCVGPSETITITVQPTPVLTTSVASNVLCINGETGISLSSNVTGTTYTWVATASSTGVGGMQDGAGDVIQQTLTNNTNTPQTVTYTITPQANGCNGDSKDVIITVNPKPSLVISASAAELCSEEQTDIDLSSNVSGTSFSWTLTYSDPAKISGASVGTGTNISQTLTNTGNTIESVTYHITTAANGCPGESRDVTITVNPTPVLTASATETVLCNDENVDVNFSSSVASTTYSWTASVSNPNTLSGAFAGSGNSIGQTLTNTGITQETVTYKITPYANNCAGETKEIIITVNPAVTPADAGPDDATCGLAYDLAANTPDVGTGQWKFESGPGTASFADDTDPNTTVTVSTFGSYAFSWTITNGVCETDIDYLSNLIFKDAPPTSAISGDAEVCVNSLNVLYEVDDHTGSTYAWSLEPTLNAPEVRYGGGSFDNFISLDFGSTVWAGELIVQETNNNCTGQAKRFAINAYQLPVADAGEDKEICEGSSVTIGATSAATGGSGNYTYLWSPTSGLNDATIANPMATLNFSRTYTLTVTDANTGCVSTSDNVMINVDPQLEPGSISAGQTICAGSVPAIFSQVPASGGDGNYDYQWQRAFTLTGPYVDISGATNASYEESNALTSTTYYRRKVSAGVCGEKITMPIEIIVEPELTPGSIGTAQIIVAGSTPAKLTNQSSAQGGNGSIQYQWQKGTDGISFFNIAGANAAEYQPGSLSVTTYFRRVASGGVCAPLASNSVAISVEAASEAGTIGQNQIICVNSTPASINEIDPASGGTGSYQYRWLFSENATDFTVIAGENQNDYTPLNPVTVTTYYKREVKSGVAGSWVGSNVVTVTVEPNLIPGIIAGEQTVCEGGNPIAFNVGQAPQGGSGSYQYQWKKAVDETGPFAAISGANSATYDPPSGLSSTTYYVREARGGTCPAVLSNVLKVTVEPTLTGGNITGAQTVCFGGDPAAFTNASTPEGGIGTYSYQWQAKMAFGAYIDIANADEETYDIPPGIEYTTTFRRKVSSGVCAEAYSNEIIVKVEPTLNPGSIAGDQVICENGDPAIINSIASASGGAGTGSYQYQWKSSNDISGIFTAIPGAVSASYNPSAGITETTYYIREVVSGSCGPELSNTITITVQPILLAGTINGDITICQGEIPPVFGSDAAAEGGDGNHQYQWQWSNNQGGPYANVPDATNATYQVLNPLSSTTYYVRKVTGGVCSPELSNEIKVTVNPTINPGSIGGTQTICEGDIPTSFGQNPASGGDGSHQYQWQFATDAAGPFQDITGATAATYQVTDPMTTTTYYQRKVSAGVCDEKYTNTIVVTVHPTVTPGSVGVDQTIAAHTAPQAFTEVTPAEGGNGSYNYQWKSSTNIAGPYANIFGANAPTYQPGTLSTTTYFVREVQSGQCSAVESNAITITVEPNSAAGVIGTNQTICEGSVPAPLTEISPASGGTGAYDYQWQESTDQYTGYVDIAGATNKSYTPTVALTETMYYRREVVSGVSPAAYTNVVKITVQPTLNAGVIVNDQTICEGGNPIIFLEDSPAVGGSGVYYYQWKSSTTQGGPYAEIPLATNKLYDVPGGLTETTYYVREVNSGICGALLSNEIKVTVEPTLLAGEIEGTQTVCQGSNANAITEKTPASGGLGLGTYAYQWKSATTSMGPYLDIAGADQASFAVPSGLTQTTYYVREVSSGVCAKTMSNEVVIVVEPTLQAGQIGGNDRICEGGITQPFTSLNAAAGGNGVYYYQWKSATQTGGPYSVISDATGVTYKAPDGLTQDMYYIREVQSGQCQTVASNEVKITVDPTLLPGSVEADQSIQVGGDPNPFVETAPASGGGDFYSFQWEFSPSEFGTYSPIPGATSNLYDVPPGLMQTTYYRRKVTSGVCGSVYTAPVAVFVESTLTPGTIGNNEIICEGNIPADLKELTPASGGNGIYTYQWKSSTDPDGPFVDIPGAEAKNYSFTTGLNVTTYFKRKVSSGVYTPIETVETIEITVQPQLLSGTISLATGSVVASSEICIADDAPGILNYENAQGGDGSHDYQWFSTITSGSDYTIIPGAEDASYTPSNLTQTTYFVRQVTSGECKAERSNEIEIVVNPLPEVTLVSSASSTNNIICSGTEVVFTAGGADLYQFYLNGNPIGEEPTASNIYITESLKNGDEVHVWGIDDKTCQTISNTITTIVNALPTATISGSKDICAGSQTTLTFRITGKMPFTVVYSDGTDEFTLNNLAYEYVMNVEPDVNTTYSLVSVNDGNGCGQAIDDQEAVVNVAYAVAKFSTDSLDKGCSPHTMTFVNEDLRPGVTYTWIWGDGSEENVTTSADAAAIEHTFINDNFTTSRTYQVRLEATNALHCFSSQTMSVTVYPSIELVVEKDKEEGCAPLLVNFTNNSRGIKDHNWYYRMKGTSAVLGAKAIKSPTFQLENKTPETIIYEVVYEGNAENCSAPQQIYEITVHPELNPVFEVTPKQQNLPGSTVNINNLTNAGDWEYLWDFGDGTFSTEKNPLNHTYKTYGEFIINLTVSNAGCEQQYQQRVVIDIDPNLPFVEFEVDVYQGCGPLTVNFTNKSNYVDQSTYRWNFGDGKGESSTENPVHTFDRPGLYSVTLEAVNIFGEKKVAAKEFLIEVYAQPQSIFSAGPTTVYLPGRPISTQNLCIGATSYVWDFGDGTTSTEFEPLHIYTEEGIYDIILVSTNALGCSDTLLIREAIKVENPKTAETRIPNAFTPNPSGPSGGQVNFGDESNDVFVPIAEGVTDFSMRIYNRWGKLLFTSHDKNIGWDGYYNGQLCPADVYAYKMELKFVNGERITKIGNVTLIR